jgi:hypothetical protein
MQGYRLDCIYTHIDSLVPEMQLMGLTWIRRDKPNRGYGQPPAAMMIARSGSAATHSLPRSPVIRSDLK